MSLETDIREVLANDRIYLAAYRQQLRRRRKMMETGSMVRELSNISQIRQLAVDHTFTSQQIIANNKRYDDLTKSLGARLGGNSRKAQIKGLCKEHKANVKALGTLKGEISRMPLSSAA